MSSIVVDLVDTALPVLERVGAIIKAAKNAPATAKEKLKESLESAETNIIPMMGEVIGQLDLLVGQAAGAGGAARRAVPPGSAASPSKLKKASKTAQPPSTNRGVRNPSPNPSKPRAGAASKPIQKGKKK